MQLDLTTITAAFTLINSLLLTLLIVRQIREWRQVRLDVTKTQLEIAELKQKADERQAHIVQPSADEFTLTMSRMKPRVVFEAAHRADFNTTLEELKLGPLQEGDEKGVQALEPIKTLLKERAELQELIDAVGAGQLNAAVAELIKSGEIKIVLEGQHIKNSESTTESNNPLVP
jgi:hypothetical protein